MKEYECVVQIVKGRERRNGGERSADSDGIDSEDDDYGDSLSFSRTLCLHKLVRQCFDTKTQLPPSFLVCCSNSTLVNSSRASATA